MAQENRNSTLAAAVVNAKSVFDVLTDSKKAKDIGADVLDIRLDHITDLKNENALSEILKGKILPVIISLRPKSDGGLYDGNEAERISILRKAVELGADYVDVEFKIAEEFIKSKPQSATKVIVSSHNFETTPSLEELEALVKSIKDTGADIVKVVTTAKDITDCKHVFDLLKKSDVPLIAFALSIRGEITRELAPKYGAFLAYGGLEEHHEGHGEWQPPSLRELLEAYLFRRVHKDSLVFGVCANPVGHSKSPVLLNAAMVETGVDGVYVPFLVEGKIADFFDTFDEFSGFSVTLPHKADACKRCEEVDPTAKAIGAVNNVVRRPDKTLFARNTDWGACTSAIEDGLREREGLSPEDSPLDGRLLILVGAGGAGRSLAFGATQKGAILVVADLDQQRAKELADIFNGGTVTVPDVQVLDSAEKMRQRFAPDSTKAPVLAHMTPVGMIPRIERTLFTRDQIAGYSVVFDAVYTPPETQLLKEAKAAGVTPVSGVEMFVRQGADQFFNFTGKMPSKDIMREKLLSEINAH